MVISAITLAELEFGITCSGESAVANRAHLSGFLEDVPVAAFEAAAAHRERSKDVLDNLIAAHAITLAVTRVTTNEADFLKWSHLPIPATIVPYRKTRAQVWPTA